MSKRRQPGDLGADQSGIMLLEALIAILVFSLGILAVIAIQAASIKMAADAQLRSKAFLLADHLIGEMWANGGKIADLTTKFQTGGSEYAYWLNCYVSPNSACPSPRDVLVGDALAGLPGISGDGGTLPTVSITPGGTVGGEARNARVTVTIFWRTPSMPEDDPPHQHVVTSYISRNPS
jgi:type IV pilus assembly protein PilV